MRFFATMAVMLLAGAAAEADEFEAVVESRVREAAEEGRGAAGRREEAIRRACGPIIERERMGYALSRAQAYSAASWRQGELLEMAAGLRRTFAGAEIKAVKAAMLERKRLYAAGVDLDDAPGIHAYWESRIADVVRPRYRAYAPKVKDFDCPGGDRKFPDSLWSDGRVAAEPGEDSIDGTQRNRLLPAAGGCAQGVVQHVPTAVRSLFWFVARPGDGILGDGVFAAACLGKPEEWRTYEGYYKWRFIHPQCVVLNLLDGSIPPGPAPGKFLRGSAVEAALRYAGLGASTLFPDEAGYVRSRLRDGRAPECAERMAPAAAPSQGP